MSYDESYFHDPDQPWMPRLIDIEAFKQSDDAGKAEYFGQFGFNQIDHGSYDDQDTYTGQFPVIASRWETLVTRFNQRYYYRMLGIETMEHWQNNLQERFDQVAPQFELAYSLMSEHNNAIVDDVIGGETETIQETNQASGSDTSTGTSKNWDTPDTAINENARYADSVGTSDGSTTYGRLDTHNITRTRLITGEGILNNINTTIRNFRDIDTWFIEQFEPLFLSVYWY